MVIEESDMRFEFPENNITVKFDDEAFYRKSFNKLPASKGVDFISIGKNVFSFIEVKNCLGNEGDNRWRIYPNNQKRDTSNTSVDVSDRNSLDIEIPQKVAMTFAALCGIQSFGDRKCSAENLCSIANAILTPNFVDNEKKRLVILVLEGNFGCHTRSKEMIMGNLQRSINTKMKWLNCKVSVVDSNTYNKQIFRIVK